MSGKKNEVTFNNYWPFLKEIAHGKRQLDKGEWLKRANLARQRYSDFEKGMEISCRSFIKLCGGIMYDTQRVETESGIQFTDDQKEALRFEADIDANREFLKKLFANPDKLSKFKEELQ